MKLRVEFVVFVITLCLGLFSCSTDDAGVTNNDLEIMDEDSGNVDGGVADDMQDNMENETQDLAPDFALMTTNGDTIASSQYEGKNLVVFFFGFNCPPCRRVGPDVEERLHQRFKDNENFAIIGGDQWNGNNAGVDDFASVTGITFPLGVRAAEVASEFRTTYDRLVIVNKENEIVFRGSGIVANHIDQAIEVVEGLLE